MRDPFVMINDEIVPAERASLLFGDLAIQRGYGIFDYLKTLDNVPIFASAHLQRFFYSARQLRLPIDKTEEELLLLIHSLQQKNNMPDSGIRLTLTGGYSPDGYGLASPNLVITQRPLDLPRPEQYQEGIRLITYPHKRQMADVKTIDYLMAIWLQPLIRESGADDVLYQQDGILSECPRANFFIVTADDTIVTPSRNILKGIIRGKVLEVASKAFKTEERDIRMEELRTAKEAFITSTTKHIMPVFGIDGEVIGKGFPGEGVAGRISQWLWRELDTLVKDHIR